MTRTIQNRNSFDTLDMDIHASLRHGRQLHARAMFDGFRRMARAIRGTR